ncbi:hypothetical protein NZF44_004473, partial [Escherichia coli]|nr:hypothetical protein [Escherichia coli]
FTPDDREQVLAVYGPVHARLLRQALDLIADYSAAIFLIPICISFDTDEKRR